jgi:cell division protein FtsX
MSKTTRNAFKNMRRMPYQALAAVVVLTITFFVAQVFI